MKTVRFIQTAELDKVFYYKGSLVEVSNSVSRSLIKNGTCVSHKIQDGDDVFTPKDNNNENEN